MRITGETTVLEAINSSPEAPALFEKHGIEPHIKCKGMYDTVTLEDAENWCGIKDWEGLLRELNEALEAAVNRR